MVSGKDETATLDRKLKMGMVGGGRDAFIGAVHRRAATLDQGVELVCGAFSSTPDKSKASAKDFYIPDDRAYGTYQEMIERESALPEGERIDFVSIVTPNHMHYPIAKAFVDAGFNVVMDKPMVHTSEQAQCADRCRGRAGRCLLRDLQLYRLPYGQAGQVHDRARPIGRDPQGDRRVSAGLAGDQGGGWRQQAGPVAHRSQAFGHRGLPRRHWLARREPGQHPHRARDCRGLRRSDHLCSRPLLDDDANVLLRFSNGARGILTASQVSVGQENNINIRVWGTEGALEWHQEHPNYLYFWPADGPMQVMSRGSGYLCEAAKRATRIPTGHPEAYLEAFGNIYLNATDTMRAKLKGVEPTALELDFPTVYDGARGVYFIERVVESSRSDQKWLPFEFESTYH